MIRSPLHRQLADLGAELANLSFSARLFANPTRENRSLALEQQLLRGANLTVVKLISRRQLGDRRLVPKPPLYAWFASER